MICDSAHLNGTTRWIQFVILVVMVAISGCHRENGREDTAAHPAPFVAGEGIENGPMTSVDLEPPVAHGGDTLFERLVAERTGIDFVHRFAPPRRHDRELANAVAGGGVAMGDYDGDGKLDVFLTRPQGGSRLYRNLGGFRFEDATTAAGLHDDERWGTGCSFADVDADGDLDLYLCCFDAPNRLYLNQGDGTFRQHDCGLGFRGASIMMSFADYDLDGDLDAYLLTNRLSPPERFQSTAVRRNGKWIVPEEAREYRDVIEKPDGSPFPIDAGQFDHLYRNEGLGPDGRPRFVDVSDRAGIQGNEFGLSATWWDFDGDRLPDLYVSNDFFGADHLYRNKGDGTFVDLAPLALPHTPWFSMGTDAADVNNDGWIDLIASDMSGTNHFKQKVAMGEMSESGWFLTYPTPRQYMRNAVYLNTGTGRFMEVAYLMGLADTNWTWSLNFGDFDNDTFTDLFVSNGMTRDWFNSDLRNQARSIGTWEDGARQFWLNLPRLRERNLAFKNLGDLRFEDLSRRWGLDQLGVSFGAAVGDLDGDGNLDLVVNNFEEPVSVYRNRCPEGHRMIVRLQGRVSERSGTGATVRVTTEQGIQMRQLWWAHGFMSASQPLAHFGLGQVTTVKAMTVSWPSGHVQRFENLSADRLYTVTEPDVPPPRTRNPDERPWFVRARSVPLRVHRENEFDDFAVQPLLPNRLSRLGPGMAWGDADGDGHDDLFVGGAAGQPATLLLRIGERFVDAAEQFGESGSGAFAGDAQCEDMGALWFDCDCDGDLDLYVVSGGFEFGAGSTALRDRLYINDGRGRLSRATIAALDDVTDSGSVVTAGDFDRDGDLDLFVGGRLVPGRYPETPRSRLLRNDSSNGQVQLTDVTDAFAAGLRQTGLVTGALWSDVDRDGWPDLWLTHEWGPIRLLHNHHGQLADATARAGLDQHTGWWNGITGRDLDNDGDIDYVATNFGLNTKYHASKSHPVRLYYGDFDRSGNRHLVEAEYEGTTLFPVRGRSCSSRAIDGLAERFPTFESFALASLSDIYSQDQLDRAQLYAANTLESVTLINDGSGRFQIRPLPRMAQVSPAFGVVAQDFNGDKATDLFLSQNFFSPQPETGRMDGGVGQLLMGKCDTTRTEFSPVEPRQSGIVLAGDAKSLTTADLDGNGRLDLIVAMNSGPLLAYLNQASENKSVLVRLVGPPGNLHGTGAVVTVATSDGLRQTAEIHSGGGYLSQCSNLVSFGLGSNESAAIIRVRWPDGRVSTRETTDADEIVVIPWSP